MDSTTSTTKTYTVNLGEQSKGTVEYGWICPVCGRGVAPTEKTCPCKGWVYPVYPTYPIYPTYPVNPWWYKVTCESGTSTIYETTTKGSEND